MSGESQRAKWVSIMQAWWGPQKVCVCVSVKLCVCRDRTRVLGVHGYWEVQGWNCSVNARCLREIWCVRGILFGCDLVCVCVCVCGLRWEDGGTPVECLHPSNLIYNSAPWRSVRSFSRSPPPSFALSALKVETSVPWYISPSLPIYPSPSNAPSPEASGSCEQRPGEFHRVKMLWTYRMYKMWHVLRCVTSTLSSYCVLEFRSILLCLKYVVFPYLTCYVKHSCLCIKPVI